MIKYFLRCVSFLLFFCFFSSLEAAPLTLSDAERLYLKNNKTISMCYATQNAPYTMYEKGKPVGAIVEFLKEIEKIADIKFEYKYTTSVKEQLLMIMNKQCDAVPIIVTKPNAFPFLTPTTPIAHDKFALVTRQEEPYMSDMKNFKNKKLGINKNYSNSIAYVKKNFPDIDYMLLDSHQLQALYDKKIDGYIATFVQMNYQIMRYYPDDLKIMFTFDSEVDGSIGVRADKPILLSIINKAIAQIDSKKQQEIYNRIINIPYEKQFDYALIYKIVAIFLIIIFIILYWNSKLKREVNKRKEIECRLKNSEERFRTLFDISPIFIDGFDENGKCTLWNKECQKVFGWSQDELNAHPNPLELFYPQKCDQERLNQNFTSENGTSFSEWKPLTKYKTELVTRWANVRLPDNSVISIGIDITQERKMEDKAKVKTEELSIAKNQLEELNDNLTKTVAQEVEKSRQKDLILQEHLKLASMGEMIQNIAHQWRQPLAQVNSCVLVIDSILQKDSVENSALEEKLLEIESLTQYMSDTISSFQNYFNPNKKLNSFDIEESIENTLNILKGALASLHVKVNFSRGEVSKCFGYESDLQQVLLVILNNAKDVLELRKIQNPKIDILLEQKDNCCIINISDNAGGIDTAIMEKIFEPYFTTKHQYQGTGLGLYMSKMIVEDALNGRISVANREDGASFEISIQKGES